MCFLTELMLRRAKITLFNLVLQTDFKRLISGHNFLLLDLCPVKSELPVTCPPVLCKTQYHWNIFDVSRTNVIINMLVHLSVRCSFNLFKCWCFMFLIWSIKLIFLFVHSPFRWLFSLWALCWCLSFLVIILEIETLQVGDFADMARSRIDFVMSPASLSDGMQLVPTWKKIWSGLSRITGVIWSTIHLTFAPFKLLLFVPLLASYKWLFLDVFSCWILTLLLLFFFHQWQRKCWLDLLILHLSLVLVYNLYENRWRHLSQKHDQMSKTLWCLLLSWAYPWIRFNIFI